MRLALLMLLLCGVANGQEWTRFRGPNGSGVNEKITLPSTWQEKDFRWKTTLPGGGHSSPVLWGDRIFVTCADDDSATRMVLGISAVDGKILWRRDFSSHPFRQNGDNSYASSTPTVDAQRLYVCWNTPEEFTLAALDHDGKPLWKTDLGPFASQHGGGNSPIVAGDLVLIGDDNEGRESWLFGIDAASGHIRWKLRRHSTKFSAATPVLFQPAGGTPQAIFTSWGEGMTAVDPATGAVQWALPGIFNARTVSSPVIGDGMVFATCGEGAGGHMLIAGRPADNGQPAAVAYRLSDDVPYVPTPLVRGNLLFFLSDRGDMTCASATTGKTIWRQRLPGSYYSSPLCAGDELLVISKKGQMTALSASEKFAQLGGYSFDEKCHSTPALAEGCMFVRTYTHLYCVGGDGGAAKSGK